MKPILFNGEMVRAILDGKKTVTRRIMKPQPIHDGLFWHVYGAAWSGNQSVTPIPGHSLYNHAPYHPGDILYVRETWTHVPWLKDKENSGYLYRADYREERLRMAKGMYAWHPSIHMPKEAARIFLRVLSVHVEKLQDITINGLQNEGIIPQGYISQYAAMGSQQYFDEFKRLWDSTIPNHPNKFKRYPYYWADNPWVWVIEFEQCEKPQEEKQ